MAGPESKRIHRGLPDRALVIVEVVVGLAVVAAIMGKAYGAAPTAIFMLCGLAITYTGYNTYRMIASLRDPTLEIEGRVRDEEREALEYEKALLLQGIKELEADYGIGKVDEQDYATLRKTAESKALGIIARLREDDARWRAQAERLIRDRLGASALPASTPDESVQPEAPSRPAPRRTEAPTADTPKSSLFDDRPAAWRPVEGGMACGACGAVNDADGRYCISCGRPRAEGGQ